MIHPDVVKSIVARFRDIKEDIVSAEAIAELTAIEDGVTPLRVAQA